VLAAWGVFTALSLAVSLSPWRSGFADAPDRGAGDVQLYRAEVDRIQQGEGYYQAAATELRARGYPTRSIFNWRTPLPMWLVGQLPHRQWGRVLTGGMALLVLVLAFRLLQRDGSLRQAAAGTILLFGALLPCFLDDIFIMPDVWAGLFMVLSLCLLSLERRDERQASPSLYLNPTAWGVVCGVAAMFLRDLAGPYCLLMAVWSFLRRRRAESLSWLTGLAAYAIYFFGWHARQVAALTTPDDLAHHAGWAQLGGLPFVLSTAQMNCFLLLLPQWVTAVYLPLAMLGLAAWRRTAIPAEPGSAASRISGQVPGAERIGLTACLYLALFAAIGHPFNQYWGQLIAPLLCFGFVRSPGAIAALWRAAVGNPTAHPSGTPLTNSC
jgi:hypothetical protein